MVAAIPAGLLIAEVAVPLAIQLEPLIVDAAEHLAQLVKTWQAARAGTVTVEQLLTQLAEAKTTSAQLHAKVQGINPVPTGAQNPVPLSGQSAATASK